MIGSDFQDVLAAAQQGDQRAFETIYRDLAPLVLGYLRGRGASDPDDLTAETFVAVVRNVGRFRGDETQFRSWVLTIAHRRLVDERRRRGRRPEDAADLANVGPSPFSESTSLPDEPGAALVSRERVAELLDVLTDDQRAVVLLRVVADLPVAEVAQILRKRRGAVKTLHRRALARLARHLDPAAGDPDKSPQADNPHADALPPDQEDVS